VELSEEQRKRWSGKREMKGNVSDDKEEGMELSVVGDEFWNRCLPTHAYKQTSIFFSFSNIKILLCNASTAP